MINNLNNFCQYFCKKLILAYVLTLIFTYVGSAADKAAYRVQIDKDEYGNERPCVPHTLQNADLKGTQIIEISPAKQDVPIMLDGMDAPRRGDIDEMVGTTRGEANRVCLGLSIDGGGIRGLMPALWLERLEEFVIDEIDEKRRLSDIFDCIGGTSIGGILSLGLAKPIPASELVKILREKGDQVFPQNKTWYVPNLLYNAYRNATNIFAKKYSHLPLETLLKGYFGETLLRDATTDVLITAAGIDRTPIAFGKHDPYGVVKMWEASRATSAAPTYFEACSLNINGDVKVLVDGGIWANNPSPLVVTHLLKKFQVPSKNIHLLSLGTGDVPGVALSPNSGLVAAGGIIDALMSNHSNGNHEGVKGFLGEGNYHRINTTLTKSIDLDNTNPQAIQALIKLAEEQLYMVKDFFDSKEGIIRKKLESK